jgi:hypothetical protein
MTRVNWLESIGSLLLNDDERTQNVFPPALIVCPLYTPEMPLEPMYVRAETVPLVW